VDKLRKKNYFKYNFLFSLLVLSVFSVNSIYLVYKEIEKKREKESFFIQSMEKYMDETIKNLRKNSERYQEYQIIDRREFDYLLTMVSGSWKIYDNWEKKWSDIEMDEKKYFLEQNTEGTLLMDGNYYIYGGSIKGNRSVYSVWEINQNFIDTLEAEIGVKVGVSSESGIQYSLPVVNSTKELILYFSEEKKPFWETVCIGGYFLLLIISFLLYMRGVKVKIEDEEERLIEELESVKNNREIPSLIDGNNMFSNVDIVIRDTGIKYQRRSKELDLIRRKLTHTNLKLRELAIVDRLTGLYNKMFLYEVLEDIKNNRTTLPYCNVVMMIDLDNFKKLNDSYGHLAGDTLLREVGDFLREVCSERGMAFRYGGDEFFLVFKRIRYEEFLELVSHFEEAKKKIIGNYINVKLGMSAGAIVLNGEDESDVDRVIKSVDELLYEAKKNGKNQVVFKI